MAVQCEKMRHLILSNINYLLLILVVLHLNVIIEGVNGDLFFGEIERAPLGTEHQRAQRHNWHNNKTWNPDSKNGSKYNNTTYESLSMIYKSGIMLNKANIETSRKFVSKMKHKHHTLNMTSKTRDTSSLRDSKNNVTDVMFNVPVDILNPNTGRSLVLKLKIYNPNTLRRQQAVNQTASRTGQRIQFSDIKRVCKLLGKENTCGDYVRQRTEYRFSGENDSWTDEILASKRHHFEKVNLQKRDADNITGVYKTTPSPEEIHKRLLLLYRTTLNFTMDMSNPNETLEAKNQCLGLLLEMFENFKDDGYTYCDTSWDYYSCWPRTLAGTSASIPCPSYLQGINPANNATKFCHANGTWAQRAVYDMCVTGEEDPSPEDMDVDHLFAVRVIYNAGFTISTLALSIALFIFLYFRSLRCLRNAIHCHLILTFILKNIVWIILRHSLTNLQHDKYSGVCKMLTSLFNFIHATNFFWMFVEGLYLHIIIVWTYSADKIKLRYLVVVGWVVPALDIIIWIVIRSNLEDDHCWLPRSEDVSVYDYIFIGPILVVLFANIIFLSTIVWVLITKLRASHTLETRQYRKAVKATIILFPLLGITYVLFIMPPSDHPTVKIVFRYIDAVLQSFQGLLVAIFYCFLNGEVKGVMKKKITRFNDARTLSTRYTKTSVGWTRGGSRDYGNSVTIGNGNLIEMSKRDNSPVDTIQTKDTQETDKMLH